MKTGKLPYHLLKELLDRVESCDERVLVGPRVGEDAAVLDLGDRLLVVNTDPITFASDLIGWYAVQVNANDVACMGATPRWFLATLLLPTSITEEGVSNIFDQVLKACNTAGVSLIGGHSEVSQGIDRPILVGCMLGEMEKGKLVRSSGAQSGDSIVITKGLAIEGTALLARDAAEKLAEAGVGEETIKEAGALLFNPGISVVDDARIACSSGNVHCLHDPTEGGLATGLWEVARAANVGVAVDEGSIPVLPHCQAICQATGLNPLGLLASGALIITLPPEDVPSLLSALESKGIDGYEIGQITDAEEGVHLMGSHDLRDLPRFDRDELARFMDR